MHQRFTSRLGQTSRSDHTVIDASRCRQAKRPWLMLYISSQQAAGSQCIKAEPGGQKHLELIRSSQGFTDLDLNITCCRWAVASCAAITRRPFIAANAHL